MTDDASHELLHRVLASPQTTRTEHRLRLMIDGVVESVHVSTVCRACRQLRLSSKKLCHYQARRDEVLSRTFVNERVVNGYEARMHLHVDETAKDGREFRRRGIAPLGAPAICSVGYFGGSFGLHSRKRLSSTSCPHVLSVKQSSVSCQRCGVLKDQKRDSSYTEPALQLISNAQTQAVTAGRFQRCSHLDDEPPRPPSRSRDHELQHQRSQPFTSSSCEPPN